MFELMRKNGTMRHLSDRGLTMVEVVVSFFLIMLLAIAIIPALSATMKLDQKSAGVTAALAVAQGRIQTVRNVGLPDSVQVSNAPSPSPATYTGLQSCAAVLTGIYGIDTLTPVTKSHLSGTQNAGQHVGTLAWGETLTTSFNNVTTSYTTLDGTAATIAALCQPPTACTAGKCLNGLLTYTVTVALGTDLTADTPKLTTLKTVVPVEATH